MTVLGYYLG